MRRLLLVAVTAAAAAGCDVAYKTDIMRKDVLSDAQQAIADARINHGDLTVAASVDRAGTTYAPGQPITFSLKTNKDSYVAILRVLPSGGTTIVFPNRAHRSAAVTANVPVSVPAPGDKIAITGDKPGVVLFEVVASAVGTSWLFTRAPDDGSDFADLGVTTRDIAKDLLSTLKVGSAAQTAATYLTVRISGGGLL